MRRTTTSQYRSGDEVTATRRHGGITGRAVRPGDTGVVEYVRDGSPVVDWDRDSKTRMSRDDALTPTPGTSR